MTSTRAPPCPPGSLQVVAEAQIVKKLKTGGFSCMCDSLSQ